MKTMEKIELEHLALYLFVYYIIYMYICIII